LPLIDLWRRQCGEHWHSYCHRVNGGGRPENAPVAGLPVEYFLRQLYDFKTGARAVSLAPLMKPVVSRMSTQQMTDIAAYLASLP